MTAELGGVTHGGHGGVARTSRKAKVLQLTGERRSVACLEGDSDVRTRLSAKQAALAFIVASTLVAPTVALSQDSDVTGAARAFERARSAQLEERHTEAADLFELAHRLAPSPAALRSAIRNHLAAEANDRAATLALTALREYPADSATRRAAEEALNQTDSLARVRVTCGEPCSVAVNGRAIATTEARRHDFFVPPGAHSFVARYADDRTSASEGTAEAGQSYNVTLEPPAAPEPDPTAEPVDTETESDNVVEPVSDVRENRAADRGEDGGLPVWLPLVGGGLTLVLAGVTVWSGLDTLSARDDYEANPTQQTFDDGVAAETRTNVLLGVTLGVGAITLALAIFTDWDGEDEVPVAAAFNEDGGSVLVRGDF